MAQHLGIIRQLLNDHGLAPKYKYGQNFLHDANHIARIVEATEAEPGSRILEIGPGTGALTEALLEAGASVVAAEIDTDLEPLLLGRLADFGERFQLILGDALAGKHAMAPALMAAMDGAPFTLAANLPYNAGSPIILNLALHHPNCTRMVVMVQKEVADRLVASHGGKDYGPLGILAQALFEVQRVSNLPPGCFYPPPKVHSAVVRLDRRPTPLCHDAERFGDLVHTLFQQRRKQIGKLLKGQTLPDWLTPTLRPEALSVRELCQLAQELEN